MEEKSSSETAGKPIRCKGEDVDEVSEGDTVIPIFLPECGECEDCKSKKSNLCTKLPFKVTPWMPRHQTTRFTDLNGHPIYHFLSVSSFSEYTVVDIAHMTKIDPTIPPNRACLLSCGVSTGLGAAWRSADVEAGSTVAIFGLGSIGLAVAEGSRLCGATRIIGVDVNPDKFEVGKKFGVTDFVNGAKCGEKSVSQVINEMTGGGADYCFECVGRASLVQEAYACCRKGWGKTVVLGVDKPGSQVTLPATDVLHSGRSLLGSLFGGLKPKSDIPVLLKRKDVHEVTEGDTVIPTFLPDCGECVDCKSHKSNLCSKLPYKLSPWMPRYHETTRFTDTSGEPLYHFLSVSSFSEYTVVDVAHVTKIDPVTAPNRACLLGCEVSTGVGAAWKKANVEAGSTVAIFGLGSIGLAVAEGARLCGASRIIGIDLNPDKFEFGGASELANVVQWKKFGITDFVNPKNSEGKHVIMEMTGCGADYCFECVGNASLVQEAYACCRMGWGKTIMLGADKPGAQLTLLSYNIVHHGKTLSASLFGGIKPKSDIPVLLKRYLDKVN
ncbi:hypothetical protein TIFTF001_004936 [Ficus carica]|uniref:Alcohol dehydrogenase-like 7 n=1 Tax=Ficus carica TaxID=3494 RepID=A0AA87ZHN4_FICCA|nr:hypothetical protein TIFTF001_004936 [Ficus carica]